MYSKNNKLIDFSILVALLLFVPAIVMIMYSCGLNETQIIISIASFMAASIIIGALLYKWLWNNRNNL